MRRFTDIRESSSSAEEGTGKKKNNFDPRKKKSFHLRGSRIAGGKGGEGT